MITDGRMEEEADKITIVVTVGKSRRLNSAIWIASSTAASPERCRRHKTKKTSAHGYLIAI